MNTGDDTIIFPASIIIANNMNKKRHAATMGRLLIDYSKNIAPLQKDGGRERTKVGMSLRYHEPLMGPEELLDMSACSLGESRGKVHPPNPSFPLQYLEQVEKELKPAEQPHSTRRGRLQQSKQPSRRRNKNKALITFKVPSKAAISKKRFETQKLHHSDSDLSFAFDDDKTHATTPTPQTTSTTHTRSSIISTAETFADESTIGLSVRSAPAATPSALLLQAPQEERKSLEKTLLKMAPSREQEDDDEDDSDDDDMNASSSFLPTGLTTSHDEEDSTRSRQRNPKKKQQPSLGEWFRKDEQPSRSGRSKTPPRSNRKGGKNKAAPSREEQLKKTQSMNRAALLASLADDASIASTSQRSILSSSQRSLVSQLSRGDLGQSYPLGPRRMLPKRTRSFDDSGGFSFRSEESDKSLHSHASSRTRRGGRRPGNSNKAARPTRKAPNRSLSSDMLPSDSFRSLRSAENSFSFLSGSRIRIRRTGTNPPTSSGSSEDHEAPSSLLPRRGGRRGRLARTHSCEEMPSLLRPL